MTEPAPPTHRRPGWWRWALVAVVIAAAVAAAVWPRGGAAPAAQAPPRPAQDLSAARARAALPPCAPAAAPAPAGSPLASAHVTCLADGRTVDLASVVGGGPALVNVWAPWCVPCRQELPALAAYATSPGAVPVLEVQVQSFQSDGLALLARLGVKLPTVFDGGDSASRALSVPTTLPASYLVEGGHPTRVTDPLLFGSEADVASAVARYVGSGHG